MAPDPSGPGASVPRLSAERTVAIEQVIDDIEEQLPELRNFILPGGMKVSAALHLARATCRRAERHVTTLARIEPVSSRVRAYLNRLSDLLFVLARLANHTVGRSETVW